MPAHWDEIARRLTWEMSRRNIEPQCLADSSGLSLSVINEYRNAARPLVYSELSSICDALGVNSYRFVSNNYINTRLLYRGASRDLSNSIYKIEDVFLKIEEFLPDCTLRVVGRPNPPTQSYEDIYASVFALVRSFKEIHGDDIISLLRDNSINIFFIDSGHNFDAFYIRGRNKNAFCINKRKPATRICFSLLHEIGHYVLDTNSDLPFDTLSTNLFSDEIADDVVDEFAANKFAQLFLVDNDVANRFFAQLNRQETIQRIQEYVSERRISRDVIINALYDISRIRSGAGRFTSRQQIVQSIERIVSSGNEDIITVLNAKHQSIVNSVTANISEFSDEVANEILQVIS